MDRTILHCDCNSFYASVECLLHPEFRDVPMAVCGNPALRHGIILAKNELAKKYGIVTAETIWQAKRKCPELVLAGSHHLEYQKYSVLVNDIYKRYTDQVEPFGIDESWLDVTASRRLFGDGKTIADRIRNEVREELGLTISVGVSFNKVFAKLGSDYKKPDATTVISRENFHELVFPLPVSDLLYVGRAARTALAKLYITTIGELAQSDRTMIVRRLGKMGEAIHDYANGVDDSPVQSADFEREIKSIGNGMTYRRNLESTEDLRLVVITLADEVAGRMRRHGVKCRTVQVTIRDPEFKNITRQCALKTPTHLASELAESALAIIADSWDMRRPIRMITVTGLNLFSGESDDAEQLSLFPGEDKSLSREKRERLETTMDNIRSRYGRGIITPAGVIGNDLGIGDGEEFKGILPGLNEDQG